MSKASKIINTVLTGIALALVLLFILVLVFSASEAKTNPAVDDYDIVYVSLLFYLIFWGASIVNIITVFCQKTKKAKKVINLVVVTLISIAMFIGLVAYVGSFEVMAFDEGLDTELYLQNMSPELVEYVFNGILVYGIATAACLFGFIISPFLFKKEVAVEANAPYIQQAPQQTNPQQAPQQTNPQQAPQVGSNNGSSNSNNSSSPFEL